MNEREIFAAALQNHSSADRSAFLATACEDNLALREQIESLLQEHETLGSFLETPPAELREVVRDQRTHDSSEGNKAGPGTDKKLVQELLAPPDMPGHLGRLANYEVTEVIGQGGMGIVLKALDPVLQRFVAVKILTPQLAANAGARKRFVREAQAAAAVVHDHIVTIHAVDEWLPLQSSRETLPYLVMQLVAGESLQQRLDRTGPLELREILRIGMQTASALAAAHAQGLIHRDVKPANILLENGVERVKITDFGLARAVDDTSLTQEGIVAGTPQYMSPQQARGETVDHRTDLFSLGSVLYAMCTGDPPFRATSTMAVLRRVSDDTPRPVKTLNADIPNWLVAIVDKLLAKNPDDRFQSAAEVAQSLSECLAHVQQPQQAPLPVNLGSAATGMIKPPQLRRYLAAAAILVVAAAGFGFSEGAGVTNLVPTMIRVFTGEGTLVVQVDDPDVSILIDGEEISIKRAGPQELRLRPGKYQFRAMKDGKPVREELLTVTRGNKQMVNVHLESSGEQLSPAEIRRFTPYWGTVNCVAISPDGQHALFGAEDTVVWFVDLGGKEKPRPIEGHTKQVLSAAFSPNGRRILSGALDATVRLWDVENGKELRRFEGHTDIVWCVAFSPDGSLAASGGGGQIKDDKWVAPKDTALRLWDMETGKQLRRLTGHNDYVESVAFSPDGKRVATGCGNADPIIRLWDVESGDELRRLEGHSLGVKRLDYSADGRRILSASSDRTIMLWDVDTGKVLRRFLGHTRDVTGVAYLPNERYCASSSWDNTVRLWDVENGKEVHRFDGHTASIRDVASSPDGRNVLSGAEDGTARLWRVPEQLPVNPDADNHQPNGEED